MTEVGKYYRTVGGNLIEILGPADWGRGCPHYKARNLVTGEAWTIPDGNLQRELNAMEVLAMMAVRGERSGD